MIVYVDRSQIRDGALERLKDAIRELADFAAANEPWLISYSVYFNGDETEMTVVHVHSDAESLDRHMEVAGPRFAPFADLVTLQSIDIYGEPSAAALERARDKAQLLGGAQVTVHPFHGGFVRGGAGGEAFG